MGWFNHQIEANNLRWWNETCIHSTFGSDPHIEDKKKYICAGSQGLGPEAKFVRLDGFLEEIRRVGFFDPHIMPATFVLQDWQECLTSSYNESDSRKFQSLAFDLEDLDSMGFFFDAQLPSPSGWAPRSFMTRGAKSDSISHDRDGKKLKNNLQHNGISMDWIVTWNDLISDRTPLKDKILRSLCDIYHHDVSCLPYDVPECSEDWIGSVA